MGYPVNPPSEQLAVLTAQQFSNPSTTRQKVSLPSGALWVNFAYRLLPGATATANQYMKVVINASSDADANGKLATSGAYLALFQGDELMVSAPNDDPITRIDFATAAAVASEVTLFQVASGVKA